MKKFCVVSLVMVFAMGLMCRYAFAEIAIGPLTKTIQLAAGKSQNVKYIIENKSDKPTQIAISARDWFVLPENKDIKITDWLKLYVEKINLAKNEKRELNFKVTVPKNAKGELAGMIYFTPVTEQDKKDTSLVTSYGVSLYVFVRGTEIVKVEIGNILLTHNEEGVPVIAVEVVNRGNVHIRPHVKAVIENKEGIKKDTNLPFGKPIFGGQSFTFVGEIKDLMLEKGLYKITAFADYGNKENIITKTVEAELSDKK